MDEPAIYNNDSRRDKIVSSLLSGKSQSETAAELNVSRQYICQVKQKDERLKNLIEDCQSSFYQSCLPKALDNIKEIIFTEPQAPGERELRYRASKDIGVSAGILTGSGSPITYIQTIVNANGSITRSPEAISALSQFTHPIMDEEDEVNG